MPHKLRIKLVRFFAPSPKAVVKRLIIGFIGFIFSGSLIFLANYLNENSEAQWVSESLAVASVIGMVIFALIAILGYIGIWYFRYRNFFDS